MSVTFPPLFSREDKLIMKTWFAHTLPDYASREIFDYIGLMNAFFSTSFLTQMPSVSVFSVDFSGISLSCGCKNVKTL